MAKILIVDDEVEIAELINDILKEEGYETDISNTAEDALTKINNNYDLIILDVMLPGMSGTTLCSLIRDKVKCPIIFVTAKVQTVDKLVGFEIGADDYITKPFVNAELIARVKANIRQNNRLLNTEIYNKNIIKIGDIEINKDSYEVKKDDTIIELSTKEFDLLFYLMNNAGIVLSKDQIYNAVWGSNYGDIGTVAVHIKNLRNKIDKNDQYIITVWGVGYKFVKVLS